MLQQRLVSVNSIIRCCTRNGQMTEALQLFQQLLQEGLLPINLTFLSIISAMAGHATLKDVKWTHTYIVASCVDSDVKVGTCLIHIYGKCHRIDYAKMLFEMMPTKNEITWNVMIGAFAQNGQCQAAFLLYAEMVSQGVLPSRITYILVLNICTSMKELAWGTHMHASIFIAGYASDVAVQCAIVTFYGKCGSLENAEEGFRQILEPTVVAWTAMIAVYSENGRSEEALGCLFRMQEQEVAPNAITFIVLVDICARKPDLKMGMQFHSMILSFGYDGALGISNALIHFYGKCGCVKECWVLFDRMQMKDAISCNGMISAYACSGQIMEALVQFLRLCESGIAPTKATLLSIYGVCANTGMVSEAYALHTYALYSTAASNIQLENALISLYGSCNSLPDALIMFQKASKRDVVTWNALLGAHLQHEDGDGAIALFYQMLAEGVLPNNVTMITLCSACACHSWLLKEGRHLHVGWFVNGKDSDDMTLSNALLNMYARHGRCLDVHICFSNLSKHDTISFNVAMSVCADRDQTGHIVKLFYKMLSEGLMPDEGSFVLLFNAYASEGSLSKVRWMHASTNLQKQYRQNSILQNALMDAYGKCQHLQGVQEVFDDLFEKDVVAWNTLIGAFADSSSLPLLFNCMLCQGTMPDEVTYIAMATSCAGQASVGVSSHLYARLSCHFQTFSNFVLGTALVKMLGNTGQLENAMHAFKKIHKWNLVAWNTLLRVYAHHGKGKGMLRLLQQMQLDGVGPDKITFLTVLSACGHEGLVAESINIISIVLFDYTSELIQGHYGCLVDVLGRCGQLDGAELLLKAMSPQLSCITAMVYLYSCKTHGDIERADKIYEWIFKQEACFAEASQGKRITLIDMVCDEENQPSFACFF